MRWWTRPLVRLAAALLLPIAVPGVITAAMWILPGDPAEIICPPEICPGTAALAARWGLDQGAWSFYTSWLGKALTLDFGNSWRVQQGFPVAELLQEALPMTAALVLLALVPLTVGSVLAALGGLPRRLDAVWQTVGLVPAVIFALFCAARIQIGFGAQSHGGWPDVLRLVLGALVLGVADGAFAAAVIGTRSIFEEEVKQRYIQIALLRGESTLSNALPNVLPALIGQLRGRILHVMSGTVVVEVVLDIPGLGGLLFDGTLLQDFGVVLAATWAFSLLSASVLCAQAVVEIAVSMWVRRHPTVALSTAPGASPSAGRALA